jgi:hypothetical protein
VGDNFALQALEIIAANKVVDTEDAIPLKGSSMQGIDFTTEQGPTKMSHDASGKNSCDMKTTAVQQDRPNERVVSEGLRLAKQPQEPERSHHPF